MNDSVRRKFEGIACLIGHTPLLKITYRYRGKAAALYAKAEYTNLTGSIKDRMAFYILQRACETDALGPDTHIVEATSGNSGISLAALGRLLGNNVTIFMPDWMSAERISLIRSFGADIRLVSRAEGGFLGSIALTERLAEKDPRVFLPRQFDNRHNCDAHYYGTAPELWKQMVRMGRRPDAFVAGVGTGGTVMGIGRYLKEKDPAVRVHPLEPANSPTLSTGYRVGRHRIQGISDEFVPSILQTDRLDDIVAVDDGDSIVMARKLASCLGLGVGISSGANFLGAVKVRLQHPEEETVVTVFPDDNKKYLSTDYAREEPVREGFLSSDIELTGLEAVRG